MENFRELKNAPNCSEILSNLENFQDFPKNNRNGIFPGKMKVCAK